MNSAVLTYADLAPLFRRSRATIAATIKGWIEREGFPPPLPGRKPRLWSAEQVMAWIRLDAAKRRRAPALLAANDDENPIIAMDRARLEQRYLSS